MQKLTWACVLVAVVCWLLLASAAARADDTPINETYETAFHVWDVCDRGCYKNCEPCAPCKPKCEPCKQETCAPEPCCPKPVACCPAPVCEYPDACGWEKGEFARNGRSRQDA